MTPLHVSPSVHLCSAPRSIPYTLKSSTTVETGPAIKNKKYLLNPIWFQDSSPSTHSLSSNRQCNLLSVLPVLFTASHLPRKQWRDSLHFTNLHRARLLKAPVLHLWIPPRYFTDDQVLMDSLHARSFPRRNVLFETKLWNHIRNILKSNNKTFVI